MFMGSTLYQNPPSIWKPPQLALAPIMAKVLVFFPRELMTLRKVPSKRPTATPPKMYLAIEIYGRFMAIYGICEVPKLR